MTYPNDKQQQYREFFVFLKTKPFFDFILVRLPLSVSIHPSDFSDLFFTDPRFSADEQQSIDHDHYLPLNLSYIDLYFLSSTMNHLPTDVNSSSNFSSSIQTMPLIKALPVAFVLSSIVVLCICGNILVILSVFTFRPLRTVQNFFIVSLAFSDMFVAIMVMPFHIVTHIVKRWIFGKFSLFFT